MNCNGVDLSGKYRITRKAKADDSQPFRWFFGAVKTKMSMERLDETDVRHPDSSMSENDAELDPESYLFRPAVKQSDSRRKHITKNSRK